MGISATGASLILGGVLMSEIFPLNMKRIVGSFHSVSASQKSNSCVLSPSDPHRGRATHLEKKGDPLKMRTQKFILAPRLGFFLVEQKWLIDFVIGGSTDCSVFFVAEWMFGNNFYNGDR